MLCYRPVSQIPIPRRNLLTLLPCATLLSASGAGNSPSWSRRCLQPTIPPPEYRALGSAGHALQSSKTCFRCLFSPHNAESSRGREALKLHFPRVSFERQVTLEAASSGRTALGFSVCLSELRDRFFSSGPAWALSLL